MKIFEERVSNCVDKVEYRIKVKQFRERMQKWKPGRMINNLSPFYFMDCKFNMQIYPNGRSEKESGYVSVFLYNGNEKDIYVTCLLSMGITKNCLVNQKIVSNQGLRWLKFYGITAIEDLEDDDEKLEIICTITKIMKDPAEGDKFENQYQLTSGIRSDVRDLAVSHTNEKERLVALETDMKTRYNNLMQGQNKMQIELKKKFDEITKSMSELSSANTNQQQQQHHGQLDQFDDYENDLHYSDIPKPKCVKCRSNLTSTSQIYQCPSGHLLCLICKDIFGATKCPVCHEPITRATGLESYLKILFPTTANFEFLSKNKLPHNISNVE